MNFLRKILVPFSGIYFIVTYLRNILYDFNLLKSYSFEIPILNVGNLSVGGTGKSPMIEYLIRLLSTNYKIATLSRGYKRKSKGFILANQHTLMDDLGDEPFQFFSKFKNIQVAVDAQRKNGIEQLLNSSNPPEVILLDDAFQHRKVKAGFTILLTTYEQLFVADYMLPTGNLREGRAGAKRANIIVVTKCPERLTKAVQEIIKLKLKVKEWQNLFFTTIAYDTFLYTEEGKFSLESLKNNPKILVAGIAKPDLFFKYLYQPNDVKLTFADHHQFTKKDIDYIVEKAQNKPIITTEKDFMRLKGLLPKHQLYYLPIETKFLNNQEHFNSIILNYVEQNTRNRSVSAN